MSATLETRVRRLERLVVVLGLCCGVGFTSAAVGPLLSPQANAQPKAPNGDFNTVKAAEVLAADVEADRLYLTKGLIFRGGDKKIVASLVIGPKDAPGLQLKTDQDQLTVMPDGILIQSRKTKAKFGIARDGDSYRIVVVNDAGKHVPLVSGPKE